MNFNYLLISERGVDEFLFCLLFLINPVQYYTHSRNSIPPTLGKVVKLIVNTENDRNLLH